MTPRRILLLNGTLFGGGAEQVIGTLARHFREMGHDVTIGVIGDGLEVQNDLKEQGFEVLPDISRGNTLGIMAVSRVLSSVVAERGIDILHTHDLRSMADAGLCRLRRGSFRHVHTFHFGNYPHVPRKQLLLERIFSRLPDRLVSVGDVQRQSLAAALKMSPSRFTTIWNGVDPADDAPEDPVRVGPELPVVGSISTFIPQKGLTTLLRAASLARRREYRFRLILAGDGPLRADLESEASRLGLDDTVEFAGWRPNARALLPGFDLFVQSSLWEAMSVVILEAMSAGRAILATAVGENPIVLRHRETALLVPPNDADALAAALMELLDDRQLRDRLAGSALAAYRSGFSGRAMAERYLALYETVLEGATVSARRAADEAHRETTAEECRRRPPGPAAGGPGPVASRDVSSASI